VTSRARIAGLIVLGVVAGAGTTYVYFRHVQREIEEREREPLKLLTIDLLNTDKHGTALGGPTTTFELSTVKFVGWQAIFDNRLYGVQSTHYRVDAVYTFPTGESYAVNDWQVASENQKAVAFTGRVGNAKGGAFPPGIYTINFLVNGRPFAQKTFKVLARVLAPGWYLLVAPPASPTKELPDRLVNAFVPISQWITWHRYDSENDCQAAQRRVAKQAFQVEKQRSIKPAHKLSPDEREFEVHLTQGILPICVASEDPCLSGICTASPGRDCSFVPYLPKLESVLRKGISSDDPRRKER
jgi:hypothetical protein